MGLIGLRDDVEETVEESLPIGSDVDDDVRNIFYDNIPDIPDDIISSLRKVRVKHDPCTVYMKPNLDWYPDDYLRDPSEIGVDDDFLDLLSAVKQIRRLHDDYLSLLWGKHLIEKYMECLYDRDGGEEMFWFKRDIGLTHDWLPPEPIMANRAKGTRDYDLWLAGAPPDIFEIEYTLDDIRNWSDKKYAQLQDEWEEEYGDRDHILHSKKFLRPMTDIRWRRAVEFRMREKLLEQEMTYEEEKRFCNNGNQIKTMNKTVSPDDIQGLERVFQSWYDPKPVLNEDYKKEPFWESPEKIEKRFYDKNYVVDMRGIAGKILNGEYDPLDHIDEYNPNELIEVENPRMPGGVSLMSRREYDDKEFIKLLNDCNWNGSKIYRHLQMGTEYDRQMMEIRERRQMSAEEVANNLMAAITNEADLYCKQTNDSIQSLREVLYNDG